MAGSPASSLVQPHCLIGLSSESTEWKTAWQQSGEQLKPMEKL